MRSKIIAFALLVITVCSMSSCLNDDNTEVTFYDDTAITSFSLGNFIYNVTLKAKDGRYGYKPRRLCFSLFLN